MCGHMTATDSPAADPSTNGGSQRRGFGVDVGGSGVKGGIVDLDTGLLIGERFKLATPQPATPEAVSKTVAAVVREFGWTDKVGVTYPGVVVDGIVRTAANVDKALDRLQRQRVLRQGARRPAGDRAQRRRRRRTGRGEVRRGPRQHGRDRAADVRHRHRFGRDPQRRAAAQHGVRPPRGRRQGGRAPRRLLGEGKQGLELRALDQGGHQGARGRSRTRSGRICSLPAAESAARPTNGSRC